jgi:hypothetical protein
MAEEKQIPFWPSWNTKSGRDYDPADFQGPTDHAAVYESLRKVAKERRAAKNPPS